MASRPSSSATNLKLEFVAFYSNISKIKVAYIYDNNSVSGLAIACVWIAPFYPMQDTIYEQTQNSPQPLPKCPSLMQDIKYQIYDTGLPAYSDTS